MDDYAREYADVADPVWEDEFKGHPVKLMRGRQ
jgi:hypothetical protein